MPMTGPSAETPLLALEQFLPYRLVQVAEAISRDFAKVYADRYGMTRPEWRCLATIGQFGTITATAIGAHSAMHKTKVSRAVQALVQRKWVARETDSADRRTEHLTLTRSGYKAYEDLAEAAIAFEGALLARLGPSAAKLTSSIAALEKSRL